jgi:phosphoglycolate phosphatase-like HAD superfamily hydrolase
VSWGFRSAEQLREAGAEAIAHSAEELDALLQRL